MILEGGVLPQQMQPALGEVVVNLLRDMIASGEFKPGEHLKEAELAAALQLSRGPVREALAQLEVEGHVELRRHRGAFVSTLTAVDVEEVYTLRTAIERLAAERACTRMGPAEFAAMDSVLEQLKAAKAAVAPENAVHLDLQFHALSTPPVITNGCSGSGARSAARSHSFFTSATSSSPTSPASAIPNTSSSAARSASATPKPPGRPSTLT